jgi:hypothetical protein
MSKSKKQGTKKLRQNAMQRIARRIESGGERLWRFDDFSGIPIAALAQSLSRLAKQGKIQRLSKGVYFRARETTFGKSTPNPSNLRNLAARGVFPSGISAANMLGFTTQNARRNEVATSAMSLPRKLVGKDTIIHTHRPEAWSSLAPPDAALLDLIRRRASASELSLDETARRTVNLFKEAGRFERLLKVMPSEPPRVRAIIGAIAQELGKNPAVLRRIQRTLNPSSRFDFGLLAGLAYAAHWQAKNGAPK